MVVLILLAICGASLLIFTFYSIKEKAPDLFGIGLLVSLIPTITILLFGTMFVQIGAQDDRSDADWDESITYEKVLFDGEHYIFEYGDNQLVSVDESNVYVLPPQEETTIQFGTDKIDWGHWLPNDWMGTEDDEILIVNYTPSNKG